MSALGGGAKIRSLTSKGLWQWQGA